MFAPPKVRLLYFDLETKRSADEVGGWNNIKNMGMACGVVYDSIEEKSFVYDEPQAKDLVRHLQRGDLIVGFNHVGFDYAVLSGYSDVQFNALPSFDMLVDVTRLLGHRLKLDQLVTATLGDKKSADGMQSLKWVKEGKMDLVREYCKKDVEVTRRLFEYGSKEGRVYYFDRENEKIQLAVQWDISFLLSKVKR